METQIANGCFVEAGDDWSVVHIRGAFNLLTLNDVRDALLPLLESRTDTHVDLSEITEWDVGAPQLLCSAHRTFVGERIRLRLQGAPEAFHRDVAAGGFEPGHLECSCLKEECLWGS